MDVAGEFACSFESGAKPILLNVHMVGVKVNDEIIDTHHSEVFTRVLAGIAEIGFIAVYRLDSERQPFGLSLASKLGENICNLLLFVIGRRLPRNTPPSPMQAPQNLLSPNLRSPIDGSLLVLQS